MVQEQVAHPPIVTENEWIVERLKLLNEEKELTKHKDRVNAQRRRLPMVKVSEEYRFFGPDGSKSLLELFEGKQQLIIYHFMFDPSWDTGCTGCTGYVNALGDLAILAETDTTFALVSRAPLAKLEAYKADKGWTCTWYSSEGSSFNYDFHVTLDESVAPKEYNFRPAPQIDGEEHGISVFFELEGNVYHTYSAYARGTESLTDSYSLLDITPYGRQQDFEDSPLGWPHHPTYG